jgi:hypothetical protein
MQRGLQNSAERCRGLQKPDQCLFVFGKGASMNKSDSALKQGLKAIAVDHRLPFGEGTKALAKLVEAHLDWFILAHERGMTWGDMIAALTSVGVVSPTGKPISVGTLSSTVGRKREAVERAGTKSHRQKGAGDARPLAHRLTPATRTSRPPDGQIRQKDMARSPEAGEAKLSRAVPRSADRSDNNSRRQTNKDVLAYMNRARSVRSRPEGD